MSRSRTFAGVTDGALHGLLESLDANSSYLSAAEYKHYKSMKNGGKADIGATVSKRFGYADVVAVIPGGRRTRPGSRTPTSSSRSKARARTTCRWPRFTAC
jgi:C-terminal processing protease CtpA/Prc